METAVETSSDQSVANGAPRSEEVASAWRADMTTFNFWEINNYKKTVKRVEDGAKLCDDFMKLVSERAEIEAGYYSKLKGWSKKWDDVYKKGPEYGALKTAMSGVVMEGDQLADIHYELKEKLLNEVHQSVSQWKKENYHKSLMSYKEVKNADEGFSKAQKPWARRYEEVSKCKKSYYTSCRNRDNSQRVEQEGKAKGVSDEQLRKLQEKVEKCSVEVKGAQEKYKEALRDLTGYVPKYQEDMRYQFNKCQEFEGLRKTFFENLLPQYHKVVTREEYFSRMSSIYQSLVANCKKTDTQHDIDWFAEAYGVNTELCTPEYEEYDPTAVTTTNAVTTTMNNHSASLSDTQNNNVKEAKPSRSSVCTTL